MQPKVSMVVPCYNKEKWIGDMLKSVLSQSWDNIELILVNDGSTDCTREIIDEYTQKIITRGYELLVIDQENQGVAAAVRNGLERITGEFVCMPDCDDELAPDYVKTMAGWLWEHPDDQWVVCDMDSRTWDYPCITGDCDNNTGYEKYPFRLLESYIFDRICRSVCLMMVRVSYFNECRILESFHIDTRVTQEPQIYIPLILGGEKPVLIHKKLYNYHLRESSTMRSLRTYEDRIIFEFQYDSLIKAVLSSRKTLSEKDIAIMNIGSHIHRVNFRCTMKGEHECEDDSRDLINLVNSYFSDTENEINVEKAICIDYSVLAKHVTDTLIGISPQKWNRKENGRMIAYAAFGKAARRVKTLLLESAIKPDVFWDKEAYVGDTIGGVPVVKPDFGSLMPDDTVLILLTSQTLVKEISDQIAAVSVSSEVWYFDDVQEYLAKSLFIHRRTTIIR